MKHGIAELELLDKETNGLKSCGYFQKTGDANYLFDEGKAYKDFKKLGLTKVQLEIYVYWRYVFGRDKLYTGDREVSRRIALILYGDREKAGNVHALMQKITKKLEVR